MQYLISLLEYWFNALPLPLLELWGRFAYAVGALLAICAYGRFTFRPGGRWGFGRERQSWNAQAFIALALSFVLIPLSGWLGSSIVLVEGAQTFESLKDVMVFVCVVLFGFPALLAIPPAYMLSDLAEGVPPAFVLDWAAGYFFWAAFVWVAYQFIGRNPDFRRPRVWAWYGLFVAQLMLFDPPMWGYICSGQFSEAIAYRAISPALFFTLGITWIVAPLVMLGALPLARRYGLFWAEIPHHVKHRLWGEAGWFGAGDPAAAEHLPGVPIRIVLAASFTSLVLLTSVAVAWLALSSGEEAANKLATRLHQEVSENVDMRLDDYLEHARPLPEPQRLSGMDQLLASLALAQHGRAFVVDERGRVLAASREPAGDPVIAKAMADLRVRLPGLAAPRSPLQFRFDVLTSKPLSRETWLARAAPYSDRVASLQGLAVIAMPESYYLADLRAGNKRTAVLCAVALCLAMGAAGLMASRVAASARRITAAAEAIAAGDLGQHLEPSRLAEVGALVRSFNRMAAQLRESFQRAAASENTLKSIFSASPVALAVFKSADSAQRTPMDPVRGRMVVDVNEAWERITGHKRADIVGRSSTPLNLWARQEERLRFVQQLHESGSVDAFEALMRRADGKEYAASVSGRDVLVGSERMAVFAVEDRSVEQRASAALLKLNQQLNALLDAAVEVAIIATDPACKVTVFNSGAEKMLGYSEDEMLDQSALKLHLESDVSSCVAAFSILEDSGELPPEQLYAALTRDGSSTIRNWTFLRKNGSQLQVSMALSAVRDERGETLGYLGIARDITDQLAAQSEMIELNMHLDLRVRERTLALQESKEQLQQALDNLRRMQHQLVQSEKLSGLGHIVAGVAHELNTPIGNSLTVASTLRENTLAINRESAEGTLRKQRFNDYLESMAHGTSLLERGLNQAATLVANFKRVAVDQGGSVRRPFDLRETVDGLIALLQPTLRKTPFQIEVSVPEDLTMDSFPGALEQVITNLVNNAVAHAFEGRERGSMRLAARMLAGSEDEARVRIEFSDDGAGMSDAVLAQIFNPFFTTALGRGGSGLGLSISYSLITGPLGGEIEVNSIPGLGSQFTITLPRVAPQGGAAELDLLRSPAPG